ncbi:nucleoside hydrolase-like domain-containing protein [Duganella lactea]
MKTLVKTFAALMLFGLSATQATAQPDPDPAAERQRVLVLTDIGNEPDDQMSLVRLLVYANALEIEGLVATTSTWQKERTHADTIAALVQAYGEVRPNLLLHATGWPEAASLNALIATGPQGYGMAAVRPRQPSGGALRLIAAADRADRRPLWISVWGGANTLAEALSHVRATRPAAALAAFVARLRVYAISDQDDAGPWIRREFPSLHYIVQPSTADGGEYGRATWTGISGDQYYRNGDGADFRTVSNEWLDVNIRAKGALGRHYPRYLFIMEGDTPAFLNLLPNGLESYRHTSWGGWGGRYVERQPYGETRPVWTQGGDAFPRVTSADTVTGADGRQYTSDQATIWRWREAFQHDFAARMDWTYRSFAQANHPPLVRLQGQDGRGVVELALTVGGSVTLDARGSSDPDGDHLSYRWFVYAEAGGPPGEVGKADVRLEAEGDRATLRAVAVCRPNWLDGVPCPASGVAHVILAVSDDGHPRLTSYRRVVVRVTPAP